MITKLPMSYSGLSSYDTCPQKYKWKFVDKFQGFLPAGPDVSTKALMKGSAVHTLIELSATYEDPEEKLYSLGTCEGKFKKDCDEVKEAVIVFDRFKETEIYKKYFNNVEKAKHEVSFGLNIDWDILGFWDKTGIYRGKIDYFFIKDKTAYIIDWKTGKGKDISWQDWDQLRFYAIYAFIKYPEIENVNISFVYVEHNQENTATIPRSSLENLKNELSSKILVMVKDEDFDPKINRFCAFCEYRNECEAYKGKQK